MSDATREPVGVCPKPTHAGRVPEDTVPPPAIAWVIVLTVALVAVFVCLQNWVALLLWALDGSLAAIVLFVATLAGAAILPLFRLGNLSWPWRWMLSAGLGIGLLATIVLICGVCGLVSSAHRWMAPAILTLPAIVGAAGMLRGRRGCPIVSAVGNGRTPAQYRSGHAGRLRWLLVAMAPFIALVLIVATEPPGILWREEGFAYDVLEYHLQLPKEYFQAGAIGYLPHNVYANFPSNAEMLYLASCLVTDQPVESWSVSKCMNAILAMLFVAACWLVCRERSPRSGVVGAVTAGSVGWVTYLSGIAYVENGMLLMGMLACGCVVRAGRLDDARVRRRWCALAGAFAGLACGFKYPAAVLIALPLLVLLCIVLRAGVGERLRAGLVYCALVVATFSPWLIKNTVMTGNPVFPLLGRVFTSYPAGWGAAEAAHFAEVHAPGPEESGLAARVKTLGRHLIFDPPQRFGALVLVLGLAGLVRAPSRLTVGLGAVLVAQLAVWLFATHLYARFAVPLLIPLVVLAAHGAVDAAGRVTKPLIVLIAVGVGLNLFHTGRLYRDHVYVGGERLDAEGGTVLFTEGRITGMQHLRAINHDLPADARVLMIGDARPFYCLRDVDYCVVFNHNPFVEVVEKCASVVDIVAWLRDRGYTHVMVDWMEIARLRSSRYGFPEVIDEVLFAQLADVGLVRMQDFKLGGGESASTYATLYAVQPDTDP